VSATPEDCFHLTVEISREIHVEAIKLFGGSEGLREEALLEISGGSAAGEFFGKVGLTTDLVEVAAAYLFLFVSEPSVC